MEKKCSDCGAVCVNSGIGTGYATVGIGGPVVCYECCGKRDRASMIADGHSKRLPLYLTGENHNMEVTNWPGTLRFRVMGYTVSRNNWGHRITRIWFNGPDGHVWYGFQVGDGNTVAHCKRTRERWQSRTA